MAINYPISSFHFEVEWGGSRVGFTEISGLDMTNEIIEYREGSYLDYHVTKMPGMSKFDQLTCKRGIMRGDNEFYDWLLTIKLNDVERRDLTISLLNEDHEPVATWQALSCFPCSLKGPSLNATGNEVAVEELGICFESLTLTMS